MTNILSEITDRKKEHIRRCKEEHSEQSLLLLTKESPKPRGFLAALAGKIEKKETALIAEIKKASPSRGVIREDFSVGEIAKSYEEGGATCLSVLTDEPFFQGKDAYLKQARDNASLPILRKDFMLDPYQVIEARTIGADCILLIMAALGDGQANELEEAAFSLGMDVLLEVHDEAELERALAIKSRLVGVNNRDLRSLKVDISTTERLVKNIPDGYSAICESGIASHKDILRMAKSGVYGFLVGESLMCQPDICSATQDLLGKSTKS